MNLLVFWPGLWMQLTTESSSCWHNLTIDVDTTSSAKLSLRWHLVLGLWFIAKQNSNAPSALAVKYSLYFKNITINYFIFKLVSDNIFKTHGVFNMTYHIYHRLAQKI
jgi:hypothetical protein